MPPFKNFFKQKLFWDKVYCKNVTDKQNNTAPARNKPKKVQGNIKDLNQGITAAVQHLDSSKIKLLVNLVPLRDHF